ncbi:PepSY-associated TM helix domain-containing protein [Membranihabitans maritimus]|uniref:PepSY-associated TM helix domain-containing protein n=1 Tax=Membranihabitans maritimus TaxID=2904244 RepID=UPI001F322DF1|nr:PepSY-associated TM helix domain-containing protein [Membranihabitans maritimus]
MVNRKNRFISKRVLFKIHSWIGINLSILFFIVCFSGTLATLSHEMDWLFIPSMRVTPEETMASKNLIVSNLGVQYPHGKILYWEKVEEPYLSNIIHVDFDGHRRYVFANQYTGDIQGISNLTFQRYFRDLHYYLFIPINQIGNYIVLVFGFLLLISLITALYFYKGWYKKFFTLSRGKGAMVFFRSLHRFIGIWSAPLILVFSITGIWYFIERANIADVSSLINTKIPSIGEFDSARFASDEFLYSIDYDKAVRIAKNEIPGLEIGEIIPPINSTSPLYINGNSHVPLVRSRANRVYLNPYDYSIVRIQKAENENIVSWINDIADPIHFGYWGGIITKLIWFVFGSTISGLILTGIWISLKRNLKKNQKGFGLWKVFNWLGYLAIMGFMYYLLTSRYRVSFDVLLLVFGIWGILLVLTYYIFVIRLKKAAIGTR